MLMWKLIKYCEFLETILRFHWDAKSVGCQHYSHGSNVTSECGNTTGLFNTLRPRQDRRHFADDIFTCIFFNENCCILITFSLKYVRKGPIDNNSASVQIMAWRRSGDKSLSEPMMISLPTHICVTRPQWVNSFPPSAAYMHRRTGSALIQVMACRLFDDITWTRADLLSTEPLMNFSEMWIEMQNFPFMKMHLKMLSAAILSRGRRVNWHIAEFGHWSLIHRKISKCSEICQVCQQQCYLNIEWNFRMNHYLNQWWLVNWTNMKKFQWILKAKTNTFMKEIELENAVYKMATISSQVQCINESNIDGLCIQGIFPLWCLHVHGVYSIPETYSLLATCVCHHKK